MSLCHKSLWNALGEKEVYNFNDKRYSSVVGNVWNFREFQKKKCFFTFTILGTYVSGRIYIFGFVSLCNGISTLYRLSNAKAILLEEQ